jgi:MYXO-CTERM domain-containing protein
VASCQRPQISSSPPRTGRAAASCSPRCTPAGGYDKQAGTPAVLKSLTLTRVRYPIAEIGSGDCVLSEYIGYISFDADAAVIPGTPPGSVVNTIALAPKYGGAAAQSRTFTGARAYSGDRVQDPTSSWMPFLDPTLEYCAGITSFGNGDVARLPLRSNAVCARVQEISLPGAGDDAGADAPAIGGSSGSAGSDGATDADTSSNGEGGNQDASAGVERPHVAAGDGPPSCAAAGGTGRPSPIAVVLVAFAGLVAVRRRSVTRQR